MNNFLIENGVLTQYTGKGGVIVVPEGVKSIAPHAFDDCKNIKKLILNEGLECFDEECISSLTKQEVQLSRILIPSTVKEIKLAGKSGVLGGKISYSIHEENTKYFIDDDICYEVNEQGKYTVLFCQNKMLGHAVINDGTIAIADCAFALPQRKLDESFDEEFNFDDENSDDEDFDFDFDFDFDYDDDTVGIFVRLQKIELPDTLEKIGANAFSKCEALSEIVIGPSVSVIDATAFAGCKKLKKITVAPNNAYYTDVNGVLFDKDIKTLVTYPEGKKADQYEVPETVENFGTAFANVGGIKELSLSPNIAKLVKNAFPGSCNIKKLYIKNDIKDIDPCAFGEEAYEFTTRDEPIEVYVASNYYFVDYIQEVMKSPQGDISVVDENDTPEIKKIKKQFAFKKVNDGLCITQFLEPSHGEKSSPTVVIPAMLGDQPIVELGANMFGQLSYGIETIVISEGIKRIGQSVLFGHSNLTKIVFPASVEEISPWVFSDDTKKYKDLYLRGDDLVVVVEPDTYAEKFITSYRYKEGTRPRIVINGEGADYLKMVPGRGYTAVLQEGLEPTDRVIVPNTYRNKPVTKVVLFELDESYGFDYGEIPSEIVALSIPENVREIVQLKKFRPTHKTEDNLPNISVAEGNKWFWSDGIALYSKDQKTLLQLIDYSVEEYVLPDATEMISDKAFENCASIKKVVLPQNICTLGEQAFSCCRALAEIVGMERVLEVGKNAIYGTAYEQNQEYIIVGNTLTKYSGDQNSFKVPEGVEIIGEGAFRTYTYGKADILEEITLPASIKKLSPAAFSGRNALKTINLPEGLTTIEYDVFAGCDALEGIHIPSTVTELSANAFSVRDWDRQKSKMTTITVAGDNPNYCAVDNVLYNKTMTEILLIPVNADIEELVIPATVAKISGANSCCNIKRIVFKGSVDAWNSAFANLSSLTEVVFEGKCGKIADYAFSECKKLKKVTFATDLCEIGARAFKKTGLKELALPETVVHIGEEAFAETKIQKITLPKSVRTLGWGAFSCVPEIEVYDSIDPDAKEAGKAIDTMNGRPNSLVGYIGMGPANAMWECAANHKWVNYTIVVKSAETNEVKYKVWMGADGSQRQYYCFLSSAWGRNATFAFAQLDEFFSKIRGAEHKLQVAQYRLEYPYDLSDEAKAKYEAYVKKNSKKGE